MTSKDKPNREPGCCFDCGSRRVPSYGLKKDIWLQAWPDYLEMKAQARIEHKGTLLVHLLLCFDCVEIRLGRPLVPSDFTDITAPAHHSIALGLKFTGCVVEPEDFNLTYHENHGIALGLLMAGYPLNKEECFSNGPGNQGFKLGLRMGKAIQDMGKGTAKPEEPPPVPREPRKTQTDHPALRDMLVAAFTKVAQHACRQGEADTRRWPTLKSLPAPESWRMVGEQYAQEFARELLDAYFDHGRLIHDLAAIPQPPKEGKPE